MRGSLKIGSIGGIPIKIHWSFWLIVGLVALSYRGAPTTALLWGLAWLAMLFVSVTVHELAHSGVAVKLGHKVEDIVLLPIGGVSEISDISSSASDELRIAVVGPLTSFAIALAFGLLGFATGARLWPPNILSGPFIARLAWVNLLLAAFNLLPALPLDGGRVFRAALSIRRGDASATEIASKVGQFLGVAMAIVGVYIDIWLVLIGIFVFLGAQAEGRVSRLRAVLGGHTVGEVMIPDQRSLPDWMTVRDAANYFSPYPWGPVPVVGSQGYVGMAWPGRLAVSSAETKLADVADRQAPLLSPTSELYPSALEAFARRRCPQLAVGTGGHVLGVVYERDIDLLLREPGQT